MFLERRLIHINLTKDVHVEFRRMCTAERMSMQEVIEHYVNGIVDKDERMLAMFKELVKLKKERKVNRIAKIEVDEIFEKIMSNSEE